MMETRLNGEIIIIMEEDLPEEEADMAVAEEVAAEVVIVQVETKVVEDPLINLVIMEQTAPSQIVDFSTPDKWITAISSSWLIIRITNGVSKTHNNNNFSNNLQEVNNNITEKNNNSRLLD